MFCFAVLCSALLCLALACLACFFGLGMHGSMDGSMDGRLGGDTRGRWRVWGVLVQVNKLADALEDREFLEDDYIIRQGTSMYSYDLYVLSCAKICLLSALV